MHLYMYNYVQLINTVQTKRSTRQTSAIITVLITSESDAIMANCESFNRHNISFRFFYLYENDFYFCPHLDLKIAESGEYATFNILSPINSLWCCYITGLCPCCDTTGSGLIDVVLNPTFLISRRGDTPPRVSTAPAQYYIGCISMDICTHQYLDTIIHTHIV